MSLEGLKLSKVILEVRILSFFFHSGFASQKAVVGLVVLGEDEFPNLELLGVN